MMSSITAGPEREVQPTEQESDHHERELCRRFWRMVCATIDFVE